ncbi:hypothetical protein [Actinoplanes sp. NPDC026670]|uniref:hypothetical protein n=1 Tax=Actinoplanes sp. NPDC026670 TaxID=3154700 RepID=UPI0033F14F2E
MDPASEAKLILARLVGKFTLLFAFFYFLALLTDVVLLFKGDPPPPIAWLLLIPAGFAFVPGVIDAVNLHRTTDGQRLSRLWRRCGLLGVAGMALLVGAALVMREASP